MHKYTDVVVFKMELLFTKRFIVFCFAVLGILPLVTDGLKCYQCNVFIRGTPWPCEGAENGMAMKDDCISCLKTYTRTYQHNTFHDQQLTSYESRLCVKSKAYTRASGCYPVQTNAGYMKRCFCHDDLCNSASRNDVKVMASLMTAFIGFMCKLYL